MSEPLTVLVTGATGFIGSRLVPALIAEGHRVKAMTRRPADSGSSGVPVTVRRAAIVVGAGGISWEMTRQLIKNLPAMVVPRWADTRTQPIALDDVIRYLVGVTGVEKTYGQVYEIGGADRLTYVEMLQQAGGVIAGRRV